MDKLRFKNKTDLLAMPGRLKGILVIAAAIGMDPGFLFQKLLRGFENSSDTLNPIEHLYPRGADLGARTRLATPETAELLMAAVL